MIPERFWKYVVKQPTGCWEWTGGLRLGYGAFSVNLGPGINKTVPAHRFIVEQTQRCLKPDEVVCHHCDNRKCVRPEHLFIGYQRDNVHDAMAKGIFTPIQRGIKRPNAKLSDEDVVAMRTAFAVGDLRMQDIGTRYKVSVSLVHGILKGTRWSHIGGPISIQPLQRGPKPKL